MILTYAYRTRPTRRQHRALESILESQRELYNAALQERIDAYRKVGITRTYFDQARALTEWRQSDPDARAVPVTLQRATLRRVDAAFKGFFRRLKAGGVSPGFPRFRRKDSFESFGFCEFAGVRLKRGRIRFRGLPGSLRIHMHRALPADHQIMSCTLKRDLRGWVLGLAVEIADGVVRPIQDMVGLDLGIDALAVLSNGSAILNLKAGAAAQSLQAKRQRALSRTSRGSKGRRRARVNLARCCARTARRRANHLHQASAYVVKRYDLIAIEDLEVRRLAGGMLAGPIRDAGWGKFIQFLKYKAAREGTGIIEVDSRYTSQDCSGCGARVEKSLQERQHQCTICGLTIGRDHNAALNILYRAGVGPGLLNEAGSGMRASEKPLVYELETLPYMCSRPRATGGAMHLTS